MADDGDDDMGTARRLRQPSRMSSGSWVTSQCRRSGQVRFRIDIGVRDPNDTDHYQLGILTDGEFYAQHRPPATAIGSGKRC